MPHIIVYAAYLFFQLYSHTALYQDKGEHSIVSTDYATPKFGMKAIRNFRHRHDAADIEASTTGSTRAPNGADSVESSQTMTSGSPAHVRYEDSAHTHVPTITEKEHDEEEKPSLSVAVTVGLLVVVTVVSHLSLLGKTKVAD